MALVREDLMLTKAQVGNTIIASVAITVIVRIIIGPLCDRFGSRLVYTWLLLLGSLPVMGIGLAQSYESFLLFRLALGAIGASFVITQYHTSMMFGPNCVGTANATTAGWGNLGGGVTQMVMPLILGAILFFGVSESLGWRLAMIGTGCGPVSDRYRLLFLYPGCAGRQLSGTACARRAASRGRQLKKIILVGSKRLSCMGFVCHICGLFWR